MPNESTTNQGFNRPTKGEFARQRLGEWIRSNIDSFDGLFQGRATESVTLADAGKQALRGGSAVDSLVTVVNEDDNTTAVFSLQGSSNAVTKISESARDTELEATATEDVGSITSQTTSTFTVAVTGAETGDPVSVSPPSGINTSLVVSALVSSSDTVTVQVTNPTTGAIDPASGDYSVKVFDQSTDFTTTEGNDTTTNVYWDSGNSQYEINNEAGGERSYSLTYEGV